MNSFGDHVHYIVSKANGLAKGTTEIEQKAKAELNKEDPKTSAELIKDNVISTDVKVEPKNKHGSKNI